MSRVKVKNDFDALLALLWAVFLLAEDAYETDGRLQLFSSAVALSLCILCLYAM